MEVPEYREMKMVLVVDDSAFIREMIRRIVNTLGHNFAEAEDGAQGLQMARDCDPDLVILDVKMPQMDGLAVLQAMRQDPSLKDVPVIMLTGAKDMEIVARAAEWKIVAYILKDDPKEVIKRLQELLS